MKTRGLLSKTNIWANIAATNQDFSKMDLI